MLRTNNQIIQSGIPLILRNVGTVPTPQPEVKCWGGGERSASKQWWVSKIGVVEDD